jgi:hypothetical protein
MVSEREETAGPYQVDIYLDIIRNIFTDNIITSTFRWHASSTHFQNLDNSSNTQNMEKTSILVWGYLYQCPVTAQLRRSSLLRLPHIRYLFLQLMKCSIQLQYRIFHVQTGVYMQAEGNGTQAQEIPLAHWDFSILATEGTDMIGIHTPPIAW